MDRTDPRILASLREWIGVSAEDMSDEKLLIFAAGTLQLALINRDIAIDDAVAAVKAAAINDWHRISRRLRRGS